MRLKGTRGAVMNIAICRSPQHDRRGGAGEKPLVPPNLRVTECQKSTILHGWYGMPCHAANNVHAPSLGSLLVWGRISPRLGLP
ncbi:hypothetical protein CMUS01_00550 [Colletotrichum musicola]|uniref:Uncharacterized protein n=1 Tax=Colletotrichum musicola TaxID=2175873 RepID=A0A8H6NYT9_9PEZI|nr:hypothetical protein CMUS01_00550 [Colletotrichum musicola]